MPTRHFNPHGSTRSSNDEFGRPPPVEVPLDDNVPTQRDAERGAPGSLAARGGITIRRTIAILAVGAVGGAGLSQVFAQSHRSTPPHATTPGSVDPVEHLQNDPTDFAPPRGATVADLLAGLDAIVHLQTADAANTDGPQQAAAIRFLHQQHEAVRTFVLTYYFGSSLPSRSDTRHPR
jgi:hypothetical protein